MRHFPFFRSVSIAALVVSTMLGQCATKEEIAAKAKALAEPVTLRFWQTHNANETKTLKEITAKFEKTYPKIKIEMDTVAFAEAQNKFKTAAKAGNAPDVFRSEVVWTAELADLGYLSPLDDFLSDGDRGSYLERPFATCTFKDETWGLPQVTDCLALLVNRKMLREAAVPAPTTMDELAVAAKKLTVPDKKQYGFAYPANESYFILPYFWAFGGGLVDEKSLEVLINKPGSVAGLQFVLDLRSKHHAVPPTFDVANDYNNQLEDFKSGRLAMFFMGPWATADILAGDSYKADPENLGVLPIPSGPAGTGTPVGGHTYVVSSASKNTDLAYLFIEFLNQPENQAVFTVKNNLLPTRKAAYELPEVKSNRLAQEYRKVLDTARTRPVLPQTATLITSLTPAYQDALRGQKTAQQALDALAENWKAVLKR